MSLWKTAAGLAAFGLLQPGEQLALAAAEVKHTGAVGNEIADDLVVAAP